jgi:hypothetical protein
LRLVDLVNGTGDAYCNYPGKKNEYRRTHGALHSYGTANSRVLVPTLKVFGAPDFLSDLR